MEDEAVSIPVRANDREPDGDIRVVSAISQGAQGAVITDGVALTYTPGANYSGPDSFTYAVSDGHNGAVTTGVSVTLTAVNDPPVAAEDNVSTPGDRAVPVDVRANDIDADGDTLTIVAVIQAAHGAASTNGTGETYVPAADC